VSIDMRRREFITLVGGAAAAWPLAARAQSGSIRRVGMLMNGAATETAPQSWVSAFNQALRSLGWVDGRSIRFDVRWNAGDAQLARIYAAQLIGLAPDVILASSTLNLTVIRQATSTVPVIFVLVSDPVEQGLVASITKPGANITGFANYEFSIEAAAPSRGLQPFALTVADTADIEPAFESFARVPNGGLILPTDVFTNLRQDLIVELATRHRLPSISAYDSFPRDGGLMSYGVSYLDQFRRAATYVDRILKGEKPGDLPVQNPDKYSLIINLKTATALGLTVPLPLSGLADELIE